MPCIYNLKVFLKCRFDGQFHFSIIPSVNLNIRLSSIIASALDYSIDVPINP